MRTIPARFAEIARAFPRRIFLQERGGDSRAAHTYEEVFRRTEALGRFLSGLGLAPGDRVALLSENRMEWVVSYLASVSRGLTVVPLDPLQSEREWRAAMAHAGARGLFLSDRFAKHLPALREAWSASDAAFVAVMGNEAVREKGVFSWDAVCEEGGRAPDIEVGEDSIATIAYTSGTTGDPKGVLLTHRNILSCELSGQGFFWPGCRVATILPLNHIYGFMILIGAMIQGGSVALYRHLAQETLLGSFRELKPEILTGVPALFEKLAASLKAKMPPWLPAMGDGFLGEDGSRLSAFKKRLFREFHAALGGNMRFFGCGGAALDPKLARLFHLAGIPVFEGYGLTETSPLIALAKKGASRLGSVGRPVPGIELRIVGEDGKKVRHGHVGEIQVRGPGVMNGYYLNPEKTREVLDGDGWFKTGDLGYQDSDGFLFLAGRKKEVIVTPNGKNVYPSEVEHAFASMPLAREVCVFGVPKRLVAGHGHGEAVHLEIFPDPDGSARLGPEETEATLKEQAARISETLPEYQRPRSVGFSGEPFPRSSSQKVKKHLVRAARLRALEDGGGKPERNEKAEDGLEDSAPGRAVVRVLESLLPHPVSIRSGSTIDMDLGLDSLTAIEFWASLEKLFGIRIPEETSGRLKAVSHIVEYLKKRPDAAAHGEDALEELAHEGPAAGSWNEILSDRAAESRRLCETVLGYRPRARAFFLDAFRILCEGFGRLEARGISRLPADGPYILAPNHECYVDNLFVVSLLPRSVREKVAVIGAREFFDQPVTRAIAKLCRVIPVDRGQVSSSVLQAGAQVLKMGKILLVHPEGTRSHDGRLLPFKQGVAILADYARCPVVPVHIEGAHEFWPKGSKIPRSVPDIVVTFGNPIEPGALHGDAARVVMRDARALTARLKEAVSALARNASREAES